MKKLICFVLILVSALAHAQNASVVFSSDSVVFYGLDFSNCRLIGDFGNGGGSAMKYKMFPQWNNLLLKEAQKYNIRSAFNKRDVYYDFGPVGEQNSKADENKILAFNNDHVIDKNTVGDMVKNYPAGDKKSGLALVFIVEKFDKNIGLAVVHITFFDIASKRLILTETMKGTPSGVGLRNYWANSIYVILKNLDSYAYNNWKRKYTEK